MHCFLALIALKLTFLHFFKEPRATLGLKEVVMFVVAWPITELIDFHLTGHVRSGCPDTGHFR